MTAALRLTAAFLVFSAVAARPAENPPCWHQEFGALSFLVGEWMVRAQDRTIDGAWETSQARCWITRDLKGCALSERYVGTRSGDRFEGRGTFGFNMVAGKLQHVWIDDQHGMLTTYEGGKQDDRVVLEYRMDLRGEPTILRDVYFDVAADSFRVEGSRSRDEGRSWEVTSRLSYTRAPATDVAALPSVELPPALARVLTDYETGWRNKDAAALAKLFAEDGFVLSGGTPPVRGRGAIERHYKDAGGPLSLRALAWSTEGDTGYIIGAYGRSKDGPDVGKFTLTLRRDKGGRWLIMSDMDNSNRR